MKSNRNYFGLVEFMVSKLVAKQNEKLRSKNILARLLDMYFKNLNVMSVSLYGVHEELVNQT